MANKLTLEFTEYEYDRYHELCIKLNGEHLCDGSYGGAPEDNCRTRSYLWVEDAITSIAKALGADVEVVEKVEE